MNFPPRLFYLSSRVLALAALGVVPLARADKNVVVTSTADTTYSSRKFADAKPQAETYVFMQGHYFEGHTVDASIEKMPFRRIAEYLAPELAKQQYLPVTDAKQADLVLVVHWGTTIRVISTLEMTARDSRVTDTSQSTGTLSKAAQSETVDPSTNASGSLLVEWMDDASRQLDFDSLEQLNDQVGAEMTKTSNVSLLGYGRDLTRMKNQPWSAAEEATLRQDLASERYFIIVKAYDLKEKVPEGRTRRAVWTLHMNMSSPGNNFKTALADMSAVSSEYFGRATDSVKTVKPALRNGKVTVAPFVILGEKD